MLKVMIVDDETVICEGLSMLIDWESYGYERPEIAFNGLDAMEKMEENQYDVIITDIRMPGIDGIEFVYEIKKMGYDAKIIILSGYREFEYAQKAVELNVKNYILKPIDEDILVRMLIEIKLEIEKKHREDIIIKQQILREQFTWEDDGLLKYIKNRDKDNSYKEIDRLFREICNSRLPVGEVKGIIKNIFLKFGILMYESGEKPEDAFGEEYSLEKIQKVDDINKLKPILMHVCEEIIKLLECDDASNTANVIELVKKYIKDNCTKEITIKSASEIFFMNPAYLGRLFKKKTGKSFTGYLNDCRIALAVKLLENKDIKVQEICSRCGYKDIGYFYFQFKERTGTTPSEFRNS